MGELLLKLLDLLVLAVLLLSKFAVKWKLRYFSPNFVGNRTTKAIAAAPTATAVCSSHDAISTQLIIVANHLALTTGAGYWSSLNEFIQSIATSLLYRRAVFHCTRRSQS
jgi:hypothetical protein